ncbi:MAG: hypothetical protein N5P05_003425 [Chroococcopsis gigantea SAG 12.99]|jgi:general stress protein YciG|nr:hypothetical protein [Chlorogloea purpurea SAG 13.99]MDV3001819.1 hypothetical protein [Chroococcopsis gigantea SAG 12.99]
MADTSKRGFASMDDAKKREIASKGGKAAHQKGTAHQFTPEEAREAGRKGGETVSRDREHMAAIGRQGGKNSHKGSRKKKEESPETESKTEQLEETEKVTDTKGGNGGGTPEPHAEAGKGIHKNSKKS